MRSDQLSRWQESPVAAAHEAAAAGPLQRRSVSMLTPTAFATSPIRSKGMPATGQSDDRREPSSQPGRLVRVAPAIFLRLSAATHRPAQQVRKQLALLHRIGQRCACEVTSASGRPASRPCPSGQTRFRPRSGTAFGYQDKTSRRRAIRQQRTARNTSTGTTNRTPPDRPRGPAGISC